MDKKVLSLIALFAFTIITVAQTNPIITAPIQNQTGITGRH